MPRLTKIYTRQGDAGTTALGGGQRVPKDSPRVAGYGRTMQEERAGWDKALADMAVPMHPAHIGAVAVGSLVFTFVFWAFGFLRMGTTGLTAQALGARDSDEMVAALGRALLVAGVAGAGLLVLEEYEHARARGAKIYAEVTGYGATSDGHDMVAPSGEGGERSMRLAMATLPQGRKITYINAHGTSTPAGDVTEVKAVRRVFGEGKVPPIASTKSMTGHSLGATGVHEAIYSLLMMQGNFIAPSINVKDLDPEIRPEEICTELREGVEHDSVLSNSFGFGGTNATLVFRRFEG